MSARSKSYRPSNAPKPPRPVARTRKAPAPVTETLRFSLTPFQQARFAQLRAEEQRIAQMRSEAATAIIATTHDPVALQKGRITVTETEIVYTPPAPPAAPGDTKAAAAKT